MGDISLSDDMAQLFTETVLSKGWSFRQTDQEDEEWLPVEKIPSTVHQDLIDNKR